MVAFSKWFMLNNLPYNVKANAATKTFLLWSLIRFEVLCPLSQW